MLGANPAASCEFFWTICDLFHLGVFDGLCNVLKKCSEVW